MEVVEFTNFGRLLQSGDKYIADLRCSRGAADFSVFIELTDIEISEYKKYKLIFLNYFLCKASRTYSEYESRVVDKETQKLAIRAVNHYHKKT